MSDSGDSTRHETLLDVLEWRAAQQPDGEAYTFLIDGETQEASITYGELYRRACAIGAQLQSLGDVGERALILCPAGLDYIAAFFGCICSGWIAVPAYAPHLTGAGALRGHVETLRTIVRSSGPRVGITTHAAFPSIRETFTEAPEFAELRWLMADEIPQSAGMKWYRPDIGPDSLACIVYTSGSTSAPKGVAKAHRNLPLYSLKAMYDDPEGGARIVNWPSPNTTTGITTGFVLPLCSGVPVTHMALEAFLERPARWIETMSRTRATSSYAANFAYDLVVDAIPPHERTRLDLSNWQHALNAGEQVRAETVERFESAFAVSGLRRGTVLASYGLTEASRMANTRPGSRLTVSVFDRVHLEAGRIVPLSDADGGLEAGGAGRALVGLGETNPGVEVVIVDPETRMQCEPNEIGEIWTAGPHVALGYWNAPEATRDAFEARLAGDPGEPPGAGPYFRTGDLGFCYEGELYIAGRVKDVIIVRGRNIHAVDVELVAQQSDPALGGRAGAAFAVEDGAEEHLVIIQEAPEEPDLARIANVIRRAVTTEIGMQPHAVVLVRAGVIPRTSTGKIVRTACRTAYLSDTLPSLFTSLRADAGAERRTAYIAPTSSIERDLIDIWEGVLGVSPIGIHDNFVDLGGDSLHSLQVMARARERNIHLSLEGLHHAGTVAALARIAAPLPTSPPEEEPVVGPVPMLLMQYGVLGDRKELPSDIVVSMAFTASEHLDPGILNQAARHVVSHHDALRMRFTYTEHGVDEPTDSRGESESDAGLPELETGWPAGRWEAACSDDLPDQIVCELDLTSFPVDGQKSRMASEVQRLRDHVDIRHGPLLQIGLFRLGNGIPDRVVLCLPHLVFDAFCLPILIADLDTAYRQLSDGTPIHFPPKTTSIRRWGERLRELAASDEMRTEADYWLDILQAAPTAIPVDFAENAVGAGNIHAVWAELEPEVTQRLVSLASQHGVRPADAVLYAVACAASDQTGSRTVLMDLLGHGREPLAPDIDVSRTLGYFTTLFPIRVDIPPGCVPIETAMSVREQRARIPRYGMGYDTLRYLCHDEKCNGLRVPDRPIRLNYAGNADTVYSGSALLTQEDPDRSTISWPAPWTNVLTIAASISHGTLRFRVEYHTGAYRRGTVEDFATSITEHLVELATTHRADSRRLASTS